MILPLIFTPSPGRTQIFIHDFYITSHRKRQPLSLPSSLLRSCSPASLPLAIRFVATSFMVLCEAPEERIVATRQALWRKRMIDNQRRIIEEERRLTLRKILVHLKILKIHFFIYYLRFNVTQTLIDLSGDKF